MDNRLGLNAYLEGSDQGFTNPIFSEALPLQRNAQTNGP